VHTNQLLMQASVHQGCAAAAHLSLVQQSCSTQLTLDAALHIGVSGNVEPEGGSGNGTAQSSTADVAGSGMPQAQATQCVLRTGG
jgi:hypothetical protein